MRLPTATEHIRHIGCGHAIARDVCGQARCRGCENASDAALVDKGQQRRVCYARWLGINCRLSGNCTVCTSAFSNFDRDNNRHNLN